MKIFLVMCSVLVVQFAVIFVILFCGMADFEFNRVFPSATRGFCYYVLVSVVVVIAVSAEYALVKLYKGVSND